MQLLHVTLLATIASALFLSETAATASDDLQSLDPHATRNSRVMLHQLSRMLAEEYKRERQEEQRMGVGFQASLPASQEYKRNAGMVDAVMQMPDLMRHGRK